MEASSATSLSIGWKHSSREEALTAPWAPLLAGESAPAHCLPPHGGQCLVMGRLHWVGARLHWVSPGRFPPGRLSSQ